MPKFNPLRWGEWFLSSLWMIWDFLFFYFGMICIIQISIWLLVSVLLYDMYNLVIYMIFGISIVLQWYHGSDQYLKHTNRICLWLVNTSIVHTEPLCISLRQFLKKLFSRICSLERVFSLMHGEKFCLNSTFWDFRKHLETCVKYHKKWKKIKLQFATANISNVQCYCSKECKF